MRPDIYTLAHTSEGLETFLHLTLALRIQGFRTVTREVQLTSKTRVYQLHATAPVRPTRKERGCYVNP
jgi:hypothetical protein